MNHYIIYREHVISEVFLSLAASPRSAMRDYALCRFATLDTFGLLTARQKNGSSVTFEHELQAIECCEKAVAAQWSMQQVPETNWECSLAESFTGENTFDVKEYIDTCRRGVGELNELPSGAFVWYLHEGPLVTFYRPNNGDIIRPTDITHRFVLLWSGKWPNIIKWTGDYSRLLDHLSFGPFGPKGQHDQLNTTIND